MSVRRIGPEDLTEGAGTPGMHRHEAVSAEGLWAGIVHTEPGVASAWHHHGDHDTVAYLLEGALRVEFGPGGGEAAEAGPGEFLWIPKQTVHREVTPGSEAGKAVVVRSGHGEVVFNVSGPEGA